MVRGGSVSKVQPTPFIKFFFSKAKADEFFKSKSPSVSYFTPSPYNSCVPPPLLLTQTKNLVRVHRAFSLSLSLVLAVPVYGRGTEKIVKIDQS